MDLKQLITTKAKAAPPRILLHGVHGIGKSTWGSKAPNSIIIQTEDGLTTIDVAHFPIATKLKSVLTALDLLIAESHDYQTVVIDTIDWLEKLIWMQVCEDSAVESIEKIGYAKGYIYALKYWDLIIDKLNILRNDKKMIICLIAHTDIKLFNRPDGENYDRYQIKLNKHAASRLEEWCDAVLFCNYKTYSDKEKRTVGTGERVVYTEERPAWKAKNRYSLSSEISLDFDDLLKEITK